MPLDGRPKTYGLGIGPDGAQRQEIIWQAPIAMDAVGTTFAKFVGWMISYMRLRSLWTVSKEEARQQCLELLRDMGEPFGSDGACWDREDAKELVREGICAYWDEGPHGANT